MVVGVERVEIDHLGVDRLRERAVGVVHVGDAAGHAGTEVAAGRPEHDDPAAGHVLAAVVADALDDGGRPPSCGRRTARRPRRGGTPRRRWRRRGSRCRR